METKTQQLKHAKIEKKEKKKLDIQHRKTKTTVIKSKKKTKNSNAETQNIYQAYKLRYKTIYLA